MAVLPEVIGFDTDIEIQSQPSKTWIYADGSLQVSYMDSGLESVRQAVEIALDVERFRWQIYNANFGNELDSLIGDDADYVIAELPRMVEDALSVDGRITGVDGYRFTRQGDTLTVSFTVHTVFGDIPEEVTI